LVRVPPEAIPLCEMTARATITEWSQSPSSSPSPPHWRWRLYCSTSSGSSAWRCVSLRRWRLSHHPRGLRGTPGVRAGPLEALVMSELNAQYQSASPTSPPSRIVRHQRRRMFDRFLAEMQLSAEHTMIDVGTTSDRDYDYSNYLEAWYPYKNRITAAGIDDASFLERLYPGMTFRRADGGDLPFPDRSFDFAHSSAVIEHAGSRAQQAKLLAELWRVARRGIFVTTPNRWFPVEFHSDLKLPRFRGHRTIWVRGVHDGQDKSSLPA